MTKFYYGTNINEALLIAQRGRILSPVATERAWLTETRESDKDYYEEIMKGKTLDGLAHELALADVPQGKGMEIEYISLTDSVNKALLLMARSKDQKVILAVEMSHPEAPVVLLPGPIYLDGDTEVNIYEEAIERKTELMKAFGKYTKKFFHVRKK